MDRMHHPRRLGRARPAARRHDLRLSAALPAILLAALAAAAPARPTQAQWREGATANPAASLETRAGNLAGYAQMVDLWGDRLGEAVQGVEARAPVDTQEGAMSRPRMHLLDVAQTAWAVIRNVPAEFGDRSAYEAADRQFGASIAEMRVASTPTPKALEEARKIMAALERLEVAAAHAARMAAR